MPSDTDVAPKSICGLDRKSLGGDIYICLLKSTFRATNYIDISDGFFIGQMFANLEPKL